MTSAEIITQCYERFAHLDPLLSDPEWVGDDLGYRLAADIWKDVKAAKEAEDEKTPPDPRPRFWPGPGGALLCDRDIPGVTQPLDDDSRKYYGGPWFAGETILPGGARLIARALGGEFLEEKP